MNTVICDEHNVSGSVETSHYYWHDEVGDPTSSWM